MPATVRLWAPVVAWCGLIFALSSVPDLGTGLGDWDLARRKLAHVGEYAVLGALLLRAIGRPAVAGALGVLYAASDELHQHFVPGRQAAVLDVAIDAAGVLAGFLAWHFLKRQLPAATRPVRGARVASEHREGT